MKSFRLVAIRFLRELRDYLLSLCREQKRSRRNHKHATQLGLLAPSIDIADPDKLTKPSGFVTASEAPVFISGSLAKKRVILNGECTVDEIHRVSMRNWLLSSVERAIG